MQLNDAALTFEPETSVALGFGFRCGFLGLLHMEIIQERLEREYNLDLITTAPSVVYHITKTDGTKLSIDNPTNYPDPSHIALAEEPIANAHILLPDRICGQHHGALPGQRRGIFKDMKYIDTDRVDIHYELPLNEIIYDFFDALKSRTRGYASFDYELDRLPQERTCEAGYYAERRSGGRAFVYHPRGQGVRRAPARWWKNSRRKFRASCLRCRCRRASAARSSRVRPLKRCARTCLAKCYGGDITRKKKLLEKQKEGKKRMRQLGTVEVPQEAFMAVLKLDE